jgi:glycosyltransferase involved in cell wall biosynthesis
VRILLANSIFWPQVIGGAETATWLLARELSRRGHTVDVLTTTGRRGGVAEPRERTLAGLSGTVYEAPSWGLYDLLPDGDARPPGLPVRGAHHLLSLHAPRWRRWAAEILARTRPDVLHTHTIVGMTPAIWGAADRAGVPLVHTLHDYHLLCARTTLLRSSGRTCESPPWPCRLLARGKLRATRHVDVVTAPSRFVLERHLVAGGFPGARAEVVPNACEDLPTQPPDRSQLTAVQGLFLGQIDSHKGIPQLIRALDALLDGAHGPVPASFRFAFAGQGPYVTDVRALCSRHAERVIYHGVVQDKQRERLYAESSFLVLPSRWHDNFPMVILEAFGRGLPVIGARRGGIPEVVTDGQSGLVVEPEPGPLATAILRYAGDAELRCVHGAAALARSRDYSLERHITSFLRIYRELADRT